MMAPDEPLRFFTPPPRPDNEAERQAAVDRFDFVDAAQDARLAAIVARAAAIFGSSTAVISIIDRQRQRWVVRLGVEGDGTARAISFCGHTILTPERVFAVPDAREDERFAGNPLVDDSGAGLRFYAGAPLVHDGSALGALCVVDRTPHAIDAAQEEELAALAAEAMTIIERLRR